MTITTTTYGHLPALQITAPDGAQATITSYGAHLVSWKTADGVERLFVSSRSALDGTRPIRGGVPVIFPQFAERGDGVRHGFARSTVWRVGARGEEGPTAFANFTLTQAELRPEHAAAWPHRFALRLRVAVRAKELQLLLEVENTGTEPLHFAAALHTYFGLRAGETARIGGLEATPVVIRDKIDRIYRHISAPISLNGMRLEQTGFRDAVVWNPGPADAAALSDLGAGEHERFVCIEPAAVDPMPLYPGESWSGTHIIPA
jgi:glucose-6-phosphate 1-epimerase